MSAQGAAAGSPKRPNPRRTPTGARQNARDAAHPSGLLRAQLHELYYYLRLTRSVDEQLANLYRQGKVVGGVYSSLGQEAIPVGTAYALESGDVLGPMIRDAGAMLVRGYQPRDLFLQYMARKDGPTNGRDANTHFGDLTRGVIAPISMLGELVPVLAGVALASKIRKERRVALTYVGDGATSTTPFHEGLNFAAVHKLPLVIVAENNGWAYSTPVTKQMAVPEIAGRGKAYGIPGIAVNGNDVLAVYEASRGAILRAREAEGPTLIEAKTMRMKGHAEHDSAAYVPRELLEAWQKRDPLLRFEDYLVENKWMSPRDKQELDARVKKVIDEDLAFAEKSSLPSPETAAQPVWS